MSASGVDGNVILLVEDDADHRLLTMRALKQNEITMPIVVATDGAEAARMLFDVQGSAFHVRPRLVLLDFSVPKIDGQERLRSIRADRETCNIPVVVMTSANAQRWRSANALGRSVHQQAGCLRGALERYEGSASNLEPRHRSCFETIAPARSDGCLRSRS